MKKRRLHILQSFFLKDGIIVRKRFLVRQEESWEREKCKIISRKTKRKCLNSLKHS
jgi:hypothetical protein